MIVKENSPTSDKDLNWVVKYIDDELVPLRIHIEELEESIKSLQGILTSILGRACDR